MWPPCIRVIVIRSPLLYTGSLFIITAVKPATIERENDMEHTLWIPAVGVSKFHAQIYFDHDLQSYVLLDQAVKMEQLLMENGLFSWKLNVTLMNLGREVKWKLETLCYPITFTLAEIAVLDVNQAG